MQRQFSGKCINEYDPILIYTTLTDAGTSCKDAKADKYGYKPDCVDSDFKRKQCLKDICWCVGELGAEIAGTRQTPGTDTNCYKSK